MASPGGLAFKGGRVDTPLVLLHVLRGLRGRFGAVLRESHSHCTDVVLCVMWYSFGSVLIMHDSMSGVL